jgi:hypothetical protein
MRVPFQNWICFFIGSKFRWIRIDFHGQPVDETEVFLVLKTQHKAADKIHFLD